MWQDVRYAVRTLRKHPGFVVLATLVLALGFGLNAAIFSIVRVLLFKPLPVEASHELVSIYQTFARQPDRPAVIQKYLPMPDVDIVTLLIAPLVLSSVVLLACYLPARRAASVDPMNVLRRV